jgi:hypothetical protein
VGTSFVATSTLVIVGSDIAWLARQAAARRDPVTTTSKTSPSAMSVSNAASGASLGSIRASTRCVVFTTSGPRRSMPPPVTNRVVSPARIALDTRLAAAVTPCSKAALLEWPPGDVSNTTVHRWRPSMVNSFTIRSSVRADARQWMLRSSSPVA